MNGEHGLKAYEVDLSEYHQIRIDLYAARMEAARSFAGETFRERNDECGVCDPGRGIAATERVLGSPCSYPHTSFVGLHFGRAGVLYGKREHPFPHSCCIPLHPLLQRFPIRRHAPPADRHPVVLVDELNECRTWPPDSRRQSAQVEALGAA